MIKEFKLGDRVVAVIDDNDLREHGVIHGPAGPGDDRLHVAWDSEQYGPGRGHRSTEHPELLRHEIPADVAGCVLDGAFGWRNTYRVIDRAVEWGFVLTEADKTLRDAYAHSHVGLVRLDGEVLTPDDVVEAVGELADEATEYLSALCPPGYTMEWDAGELCMVREEEEEG